MRTPRVYLITDRRIGPLLPKVEAALTGLPAGIAAVQLRERDLGGRDLLELARELKAICAAHGQFLTVNDRIDVALAAGADGVHLPSAGVSPNDARRLLGPAALIAVSCHSAADIARARDAGADFATFGPIFDTPSKRAYGEPVGLESLREAAKLGLPLVGLGGISVATAPAVWKAGALGIGVIRAWLTAPDPSGAIRGLLAGFGSA
jgi:thiamine-phosphate pyrophosphorylase